MRQLAVITLIVVAGLPANGRAEHARIDLIVARLDAASGRSVEETSASADCEPPVGGLKPRPLAKVKAGEPLALQFILTNLYPHGVKKDVTVRYFIVREQKVRQKSMPDPNEGAVTEGQFLMNLKPHAQVGARVRFTVKSPGIYLLRIDTRNTDSDHEHFSAIDLQVE